MNPFDRSNLIHAISSSRSQLYLLGPSYRSAEHIGLLSAFSTTHARVYVLIVLASIRVLPQPGLQQITLFQNNNPLLHAH